MSNVTGESDWLAAAFKAIDRQSEVARRAARKPRRPLLIQKPDGGIYVNATADEAIRAQRWVDARLWVAVCRAEWPPR